MREVVEAFENTPRDAFFREAISSGLSSEMTQDGFNEKHFTHAINSLRFLRTAIESSVKALHHTTSMSYEERVSLPILR